MKIPEEARITAADLSDVASRFMDFVEANPACARPIDHLAADLPSWVADYAYPLQAWPIFVGGRKLQEIQHATITVTRLVKSVLERIFGNDCRRICDYYEFDNESLAALLLAPPNGIYESLARVDFIDSREGFKCLEVNTGAYLGGWQLRFWEEMYRTDPELSRFFAEQGIDPWYQDPFRELFKHLASEAIRKGTSDAGAFNTLLVVTDEGLANAASASPLLNQLYSSALAEKGLEGKLLICVYPDSFSIRRGELYKGGDRIQAVLEYTDIPTPTEVYRCFKAETTSLYNGPLARVLGDKRNLALLSEYQDSDVFTRGEKEFLEKHLPWSRVLDRGKVLYRGEKVDLEELLLNRREDFVLKRGRGARGEGVMVGRRTPQDEWEAQIREAIGTPRRWLVQEHVSSRPYLYPHQEGLLLHDVVWGLFCFGSSYGGGFLRVMPSGRGSGVINAARGASEGIIFEV